MSPFARDGTPCLAAMSDAIGESAAMDGPMSDTGILPCRHAIW